MRRIRARRALNAYGYENRMKYSRRSLKDTRRQTTYSTLVLLDILNEILRFGRDSAIPQRVERGARQEAMVFPGEAREDDLGNEAPTPLLRSTRGSRVEVFLEKSGHLPDARRNEQLEQLASVHVRAHDLCSTGYGK